MSQDPTTIADGTGAQVLAAINAAILTLKTCSSGAAAPANPDPFMFWADTANNKLKQRNAANNGWVELWDLTVGIVGAQVKVSSSDSTPNYLLNKLVAGGNVSLTKSSVLGVETITIAASGGVPTDAGYAGIGTFAWKIPGQYITVAPNGTMAASPAGTWRNVCDFSSYGGDINGPGNYAIFQRIA